MYIGILLKLFVGFFGAIIVMRIVGKKALSDLTPYDIIYSIILGGIVQEGLYDDAVHIGHILFALLIWGVVIYSVEILFQSLFSLSVDACRSATTPELHDAKCLQLGSMAVISL